MTDDQFELVKYSLGLTLRFVLVINVRIILSAWPDSSWWMKCLELMSGSLLYELAVIFGGGRGYIHLVSLIEACCCQNLGNSWVPSLTRAFSLSEKVLNGEDKEEEEDVLSSYSF